jgi:DNA polymerase, archaea type
VVITGRMGDTIFNSGVYWIGFYDADGCRASLADGAHKYTDYKYIILMKRPASKLIKKDKVAILDDHSGIGVTKDFIKIDDSDIDLDCEPVKLTYKYEPRVNLTPYEDLSKIYIDIETSGLDPKTCRIYMVGFWDTKLDDWVVFKEDEERETIVKSIDYLTTNQPNILAGHNHVRFDLPFITKRAELYNISVPWKINVFSSRITSASVFGKPLEYNQVTWYGTNIIDTYHQIAIWDKAAAKLEAYDLKSSVIALKLRDDRRLELNVHQIKECWAKGDKETIEEYLKYDLSDTKMLADFLLPTVYYQLLYIPSMTFQQISVANALKFQKLYESLECHNIDDAPAELLSKTEIIGKIAGKDVVIHDIPYLHTKEYVDHHMRQGISLVESDEKVGYEGGISKVFYKGLHHDVAKIDVSSMYPSVMLRYGVCSRKDPLMKSLSVLKNMTEERLKFKALAAKGDKQANHRQGALKILINSFYGFLGTGYYTYNDMEAAALVTAIGRKILYRMIDSIEAQGGMVIAVDTDGIIYSHENTNAVYNNVTKVLPSGVGIELEFEEMGLYAPKAKNYVLVSKEGKVSCKGMYRKRNRYPLQNKHPLELIRRYFMESKESAIDYHIDTVLAIKMRTIDIADLTVTRKIGKAEKSLVEQGLGQVGDKVSYWTTERKQFGKTGKPIKSKKSGTTTEPYWAEYYLDDARESFIEIFGQEELDNIFA